MVFVDILTSQLFALGFAGLITLYMVVDGYLLFRKGKKAERAIRSGALPLAVIGVYILISGLFGQFAWPLPGAYNILYYDVYPLLGLMLIGVAYSVYKKLKMQYMGFMGLLVGIMGGWYGIMGYLQNLSSSPMAVLGLFGCFGLAGVFSYPMTVMIDRMEEGEKPKHMLWTVFAVLFCVFLTVGTVIALFTAFAAVPAHLAMPP